MQGKEKWRCNSTFTFWNRSFTAKVKVEVCKKSGVKADSLLKKPVNQKTAANKEINFFVIIYESQLLIASSFS